MQKPRVNARSIPWLMELWRRLDDYWKYNDDITFRQAPSDVFDGWATPSELSDLVRRRILTVVQMAKGDQNSISPVTWYFTDRGIGIMRAWHEKAVAKATELPIYDEHCCPNCGSPLDA